MALSQINPQEKKKKPSKLETFAKFAQIGGSLASMGKNIGSMFDEDPTDKVKK
jgi:hypothetical protein